MHWRKTEGGGRYELLVQAIKNQELEYIALPSFVVVYPFADEISLGHRRYDLQQLFGDSFIETKYKDG